MIGVTLLSCYPPGGLQHVCFSQSPWSPGYYDPCGYGSSCYGPRGYSYLSGSSSSCCLPRRYQYLSGWGNTCYDPCGYGYPSVYGGSCYSPDSYSWGPFCRSPRYATRRRYSFLPSCYSGCYSPCGYGYGGQSVYGRGCYDPCGYGYGVQSVYSRGCYDPCGSSFAPICRPPRYAYRRRYTDLSGCGTGFCDPCSYGTPSCYGSQLGSCYDPCDYTSGSTCRPQRHAYRRRYSSEPLSSDPCCSDSSALCPSRSWKHRSSSSKPC